MAHLPVVRVLFVCLGNICRSPTAEGVFRSLVEDAGLTARIETKSAGTHAYHSGEGADPRSTRAARRRGYDLSGHKARPVEAADLENFDYVLAMDGDNLRHLKSMQQRLGDAGDVGNSGKSRPRAEVGLFLGFAPAVKFDEVPDPYARGEEGFELVLDMIESAGEALLEHIRARNLAPEGLPPQPR